MLRIRLEKSLRTYKVVIKSHMRLQRQSRQNDNNENYLSRKLNDLGALESKVKEDNHLSDDNKQKLKREIDRAHQNLMDNKTRY